LQKLGTTDFGRTVFAKSNAVANKAGIFRRIFDAIFEWGEKQADGEIARFVARSGGRFTDGIEREMMQWPARR
jgi:hypothetical protein